MMDISIVIPCYNEDQRIESLIQMLQVFVKTWKGKYEIIFVDDGSDYPLHQLLEERKDSAKHLNFKVITLDENQGKGAALKAGVLEATMDYVLTIDADGSYDPKEVSRWLSIQNEQPKDEIWIGSRMHSDSKLSWEVADKKAYHGVRKWMGWGYNAYIKLLTSIDSYDTQSGIKLYPKDVAQFLFHDLENKGWAHDVSLLYKASLHDLKIVEQPVDCVHKEGSKINLLKDTIDMFLQTIKISLQEKWQHFIVTPIKSLKKDPSIKYPPNLNQKTYRRESIFRGLFVLWAMILLIAMPSMSKDFAIAGDEWIQNEYGKEIYNYFASGDPRAHQEVGRIQQYDAIVYYSGGYELLLVTIAKWFPNSFEYDIRHALVAFTGAWLFIFTGLLGRRFGGWMVGFISMLLISLSPRLLGEAMNNSKDIPFALGVVFTLYHMIPFLRKLPNPSWRSVLWITVGLAFTYNIRIGAFIVVGYLGVFSMIALAAYWKREGGLFKKHPFRVWRILALKFLTILIVSYFLGIITWPWAMQDPLFNPANSMKQMANFPITLRILFGGEAINTAFVPWTYVPVWMGITTPEIILALFLIAIPGVWWMRKHFKKLGLFILFFTLLFPIVFAIIQKSVLYDGWRHFLFVYPSMVILAAMAFVWIYKTINKTALKAAWVGLLMIGLIFPIHAMWQIHPYEYVYFNHAYGGLPKALGNYETDYYFTSAKEAINTLAEKENFYELTDSIYIRTNMVKEVTAYASLISPYLVIDYLKFENRYEAPYDFAIFNSRFLDLPILKQGSWEPKNEMYFSVSRQGVPLSIVLKRPSQKDYIGYYELEQKNPQAALTYFQEYLDVNPEHEGVLYYAGIAAMQIKNFDLASAYLRRTIDFYSNDAAILNYALCQIYNHKPQEALQMLNMYLPRIKKSYDFYSQAYEKNPDSYVAQSLMMMDKEIIEGYYQMLTESYRLVGDQRKSNYYSNELSKLN